MSSVLFRSYDREDFVTTDAARRVTRLVEPSGSASGCFGVAGPRGVGKTWLLQHAAAEATRTSGIGVYFPAPSAYDGAAFIASIADALAVAVAERFRPRLTPFDFLRQAVQARGSPLIVGAAAAALSATFYASRGLGAAAKVAAIALLAGAGYIWLLQAVSTTATARRRLRSPVTRLFEHANAMREWLRYASTLTTGSEVALEVGKGIVGKAKATHQLGLAERPVTLASLVYEFRDLAAAAAVQLEETRSGARLVLCIDELDKIGDPDEVRALLRDVKGIFDIPGVVVLVSVSEEALRSLSLGNIRARDEFNSTFATVIEVDPFSAEAADILVLGRSGRSLPSFTAALTVMTGGNPREIVRVADQVLSQIGTPMDDRELLRSTAASVILGAETSELIRLILAHLDLTEADKVASYQFLSGLARADLVPLAGAELLEAWEPDWASPQWTLEVGESWKRLLLRVLLIRRVVAGDLDANDAGARADAIAVSVVAAQSAGVARLMATERGWLGRVASDGSPQTRPTQRRSRRRSP